jgi:glyoxylase-like metal-dependent hydrolase (beta-lactamase superfamily II)
MNKTLGMILITLVCTYTQVQTVHAEDRFAAIEITTQQITDRIYVLFGAGGNIGISKGNDGLLMIDDQFAPLAPKIKAALKALGEESPVYLLNTHYHGDHVGGNGIFGADSLIIAHQNVRLRLLASDPPKNFADVSLPVITYEKRANLYFNGEEIQLIHAPKGHTDGDSVIYFSESNVVHLGDHFFKDRFPFVDLNSGGSVDGMIANIETVLSTIKDDTRVIPGHGSLATKTDLQIYLVMLKTTSDLVKNAIGNGDSLDTISVKGLGSQWESWGSGFINEERWLQTLYRSYQT